MLLSEKNIGIIDGRENHDQACHQVRIDASSPPLNSLSCPSDMIVMKVCSTHVHVLQQAKTQKNSPKNLFSSKFSILYM